MSSNITIKPFDNLTSVDLYHILRARSQVFVVEQHCAYQDIDGIDFDCMHLVAHRNAALTGYCRIIGPHIVANLTGTVESEMNDTTKASIPTQPSCRIGRVLVLPQYRGQGQAHDIVEQAIKYCQSNYAKHPIAISAQTYLTNFYNGFGFEPTSAPYLEDGIEHIDMVLLPKKQRFGAGLFKRKGATVKATKPPKVKSGTRWTTWIGILFIILGLIFIAGLVSIMELDLTWPPV